MLFEVVTVPDVALFERGDMQGNPHPLTSEQWHMYPEYAAKSGGSCRSAEEFR